MQPRHVLPELNSQWAAAVGTQRLKHAFAWRSLRDAGAVLAFSSDWDVSEMEPLIGIYSAVTRQGLDGMPPGGWVPEQAIDLEDAVRAYTIDGAYANFVEENRGSIRAGKYADLILLFHRRLSRLKAQLGPAGSAMARHLPIQPFGSSGGPGRN